MASSPASEGRPSLAALLTGLTFAAAALACSSVPPAPDGPGPDLAKDGADGRPDAPDAGVDADAADDTADAADSGDGRADADVRGDADGGSDADAVDLGLPDFQGRGPCDGGTLTFATSQVISGPAAPAAEAEVSLAATPAGLVAAWIHVPYDLSSAVLRASATSGTGFSTPVDVPFGRELGGDPTLGVAADGTVFLGGLCSALDLGESAVCVAFSTDGGLSFSTGVQASDGLQGEQPDGNRALRDRPWLAVSPAGEVVMTWGEILLDPVFNPVEGQLRLAVGRVDQGVLSFDPSVPVNQGDGAVFANAGTVTFDPGGRLHVAYSGISSTGGGSFAGYARSQGDLGTYEPARSLGPGLYPSVATVGNDQVAVTFMNGGRLWLRTSGDGGETFAPPLALTPAGREAELSWLISDGGAFHLAWLEREPGPGKKEPWTLRYTHLVPGPSPTLAPPLTVQEGIVGTPEREGDHPRRWIGDYLGLAAPGGLPSLAWTQSAGGAPRVAVTSGRCE